MKCCLNLCGGKKWAMLFLRIAVGSIFIAHGLAKWSMWDAVPSAQLSGGMITLMKVLSIAEPLGGAAVILGIFTQFAAIGFILVMLGALYMKIKTFGAPFVGGWELEFLVLAASILLAVKGCGKLGFDHMICGKWCKCCNDGSTDKCCGSDHGCADGQCQCK